MTHFTSKIILKTQEKKTKSLMFIMTRGKEVNFINPVLLFVFYLLIFPHPYSENSKPTAGVVLQLPRNHGDMGRSGIELL